MNIKHVIFSPQFKNKTLIVTNISVISYSYAMHQKLSCREHENHDIVFCKASTHQGDAAAFNCWSVGRQCLPHCLIAFTMTAV